MSEPVCKTPQERENFLRAMMIIKSSPSEIVNGEKIYDVCSITLRGKVSESGLKWLVMNECEWLEPVLNEI